MFISAFIFRNPARAFAVAVATVLLTACGTKHVSPVEMSQVSDDRMTCNEIAQEISRNQASVVAFVQQKQGTDAANAAKVASSLLLLGPVGVGISLTIDLSDEERIMVQSLKDRNEALVYMQDKKHCQK
jgi:uncharacterized protein YejL (UPF0352 family)